MSDPFKASISSLRHVEEKRAGLLAKLDIFTVGDMALHLPARYLDLSHVAAIGAQFSGDVTCSGVVTSVKVRRPRPRLTITEVALTDETGTVFGVWFNQPWVQATFKHGQRYAFAGAMTYERGMRHMNAPFFQALEGEDAEPEGAIVPIYPATEGLSQGWIRRIAAEALDAIEESESLIEIVPRSIRDAHHMRTFHQALKDVHRPRSVDDAAAARNRLAYQELFELSLLNTARKRTGSGETAGYSHTVPADIREQTEVLFGFKATEEQVRAIDEIASDMAAPHPMTRLLLGDVGTGKTFVATAALLAVAQSGTQAAVMAPTEVLAKQYAAKLGPLLDRRGISWTLVAGSLGATERSEAIARIEAGDVTVAFGTHALIQPDVSFRALTLAVVDEQHRFGVRQRALLRAKALKAPDMLSMTATPIPRSLALTVFGDLNISTLKKRPIKGAGVSTFMRRPGKVSEAHEAVKEALDAGQQAYVVCALIEESSKLEVSAAVDLAQSLADGEYRNYRVGLLHGNMKSDEKDEVMERFRTGEIDVLVSTTVIEVGVDIHNATRMVVIDADRFGLAQLHQLRGRVGRGSIAGQMWLISDTRSQTARQRFEALCSTDDGFVLADIDLALRGAGDIIGTRQHGPATFRVADLMRDLPIIELAGRDVAALLDDDPPLEKPEHQSLKKRLELLQEGYEMWVSAG